MAESIGCVILMGMTGAGKSTFISRLTGLREEVGIGHSLSSKETAETACYSAQYNDKRVIHLIDTPGFDDTSRPDADILYVVASRLATLYRAHQPILGIVLLHRITDVRLSGSAVKNVDILQRICGPQNYDRVVLATTMWENAAIREGGTEAATEREDQLWDFWNNRFQGKSRMVRHETDTQESAQRILSYLVDHPSASQPLQIQRELVDESMKLDQTEAGSFIRRDLLAAKEKLDRKLAELQTAVEETTRLRDNQSLHAIALQEEGETLEARSTKRRRLNGTRRGGDDENLRRPSLVGRETGTRESEKAVAQQEPDEWTRYIPRMILNWFPGPDSSRISGNSINLTRWPSLFGSSKPGESTTSLAFGGS